MSKGVNSVTLSGNVGNVTFGQTKDRGDEVCSFTLAIEKGKDFITWVRINVFGGNVVSCKEFLDKGVYVIVQGELMNRYSASKEDKVLEVRCLDIKFL